MQFILIDSSIKSLTSSSNVKVITQSVPYKQLKDIYIKSESVLIPVKETGGGVYGYSSLLDALSFSKPVIASQTEGIALDINKLGIGKTYDCGNPESFAQAIRYVSDHYEDIVSNIISFIDSFNIFKFCESLAEEIKKLL